MKRKLNFQDGTKRLTDGYAENEEMLSWTSHPEGSWYSDEKMQAGADRDAAAGG
jgi:hypothetical protein